MRGRLVAIVSILALVACGFRGPVPVSAQGQVYTDTMDSAAVGLMSTNSSTPGVTYSYQNGQFLVQASDPSFQGELVSFIGVPEMGDSRTTVDVAIGGDPNSKYVLVGCRANETSDGYMLALAPASGQAILFRADPADDVVLQRLTDTSVVNVGNANNQIGIDCTGNVISGIVNGQNVLSVTDSTYAFGGGFIGVGASGDQTDGLTAGFDNLSVTDLGAAAQPTAIAQNPTVAAPTVAAPTVVAPPVEAPTLAAPTLAVPTAPAPTVAAPTVAAPTLAVPTAPAPTVAAPTVTTGETAPISDPNVDPVATLGDAFSISLEWEPLVSDLEGEGEVTLDFVRTLPAGVQVADFYAELNFVAPQVPVGTSYLVGFCFWVDPAGSCYDIYLRDDGTGNAEWGYGYDSGDGSYQTLSTGALTAGSVDPTPGASNFLSLTVYQGVAILSGETFQVAAVIPLEGTPVVGDVKAEIGFIQDPSAAPSTAPSLLISLSNFAVWDLSAGVAPAGNSSVVETPAVLEPTATTAALPTLAPPSPTAASLPTLQPTVVLQPTTASVATGPILPPLQSTDVVGVVFDRGRAVAVANAALVGGLSGTFIQEDSVYASTSGGIVASDFYTLVTFINPTDVASPFDVGIGFRASGGTESGLRFVVMSTGAWYLLPPGGEATDSGMAPSFNATPGAQNTIEILAQGGTAIIVINGVVLKQVNVSAAVNPGDVYVGTGFFQGDTIPGRQISFTDWWVFPLTA